MTTALRGYLRFLAAHGACRPWLDRAVPVIPQWRLSALPRYLPPADVERLIASCDLTKPHGIRDKAILLLLARLGLRAGDILGMRLDDIEWDEGTLRVRGKGRREVRLPLPQDAGDALLELPGTGPAARRRSTRMFLRSSAPYRSFAGPCAISDVVRLALKRAEIADPPSRGTNLLRHSAATANATRRCHVGRNRSRAPASIGRYDRSLRQGRCRHAAADRAALAGRRVMLSQDLTRYVDLHRSLGLQVPHPAFAAHGTS